MDIYPQRKKRRAERRTGIFDEPSQSTSRARPGISLQSYSLGLYTHQKTFREQTFNPLHDQKELLEKQETSAFFLSPHIQKRGMGERAFRVKFGESPEVWKTRD